MANVFAILSAIALAAALFLANKNKEAYSAEIIARQEQDAKLVKETQRLNDLTDQFNSTEKERKATEDTVAGLKEQESAAQAKNKTDDAAKAKLTAEVDANESKIKAVQDSLEGSGDISELAQTMKRTAEEIAGLTDELTSNNATLANLVSEKARTEGVIAAQRKRNSDISNKISFFSGSSISSIYPAFGFVTIPVGSSAGAVPGSTLDVVRDGTVIAKLRVRTVETGRSSADIVPDSLAADTTLQVGDRVVPATEGSVASNKPAN